MTKRLIIIFCYVITFAAGAAVSPEQALPVYLRDEVAWQKSTA